MKGINKKSIVFVAALFSIILAYVVLADVTRSVPILAQNITYEGFFAENTLSFSNSALADISAIVDCYLNANTTNGVECIAPDGTVARDAVMYANLSTPAKSTINYIEVYAVITETGTTNDNCGMAAWNYTSSRVVSLVANTTCATGTFVTLSVNLTDASSITDLVFSNDTANIFTLIAHTSGLDNADLRVDSLNITVGYTPAVPVVKDCSTPAENNNWSLPCGCRVTRRSVNVDYLSVNETGGDLVFDTSNITFRTLNITSSQCTIALNGTQTYFWGWKA